MPLVEACSLQAFDQNVRTEIRNGRPPEQAAAIARDMLERSCRRLDQPVPTRRPADAAKRSSKPRTREYLESALEKARKVLPGWMYSVIHQAALPASGGRAKANRMSTIEKMWVGQAGADILTDGELLDAHDRLESAVKDADRRGLPVLPAMTRLTDVELELERRGFEPTAKIKWTTRYVNDLPDSAFLVVEPGGEKDSEGKTKPRSLRHFPYRDASGKVDLPHIRNAIARIPQAKFPGFDTDAQRRLQEKARRILERQKEKVGKGFLLGGTDGGAHAHALHRVSKQTALDGAHGHVFVLPGQNTPIFTHEDGVHQHPLKNGSLAGGAHSHHVSLPDGRQVTTSLDGEHAHGAMIETTLFDALHQHVLALEDGTTVTSLTVDEFIEKYPDGGAPPEAKLPAASTLTGAWHRCRLLELEREARAMMPMPEAVEMAAKGDSPEMPKEVWEVKEVCGDWVIGELSGGEVQKELVCPLSLEMQPGDTVEVMGSLITGFSDAVLPDSQEAVTIKRIYAEELRKAAHPVEFQGPRTAPLVFVCASPSPLERARYAPLVSKDSELFESLYLAPLGLTKKDVGLGFVYPVEDCQKAAEPHWRAWFDKSLKEFKDAKVVALGKVAKEALSDSADFVLPHPAAVRRFGNSGEVTRKVRAIAKALDISIKSMDANNASRPSDQPSEGGSGATLAESISELRKGDAIRCRVVKSAPEKQIVYGVVLDPYSVDTQDEWVPPATIEDSAHEFLEKSRVIGLRHTSKAEATLVESWVEIYPSPADREAALENRPHRVFKRRFGDDEIHSGSWMAGVRLSDELWDLYKRGELGAFSVGGFSFKTKVTTDAMPDVEYIELSPTA